jgi:hypothetical protein
MSTLAMLASAVLLLPQAISKKLMHQIDEDWPKPKAQNQAGHSPRI